MARWLSLLCLCALLAPLSRAQDTKVGAEEKREIETCIDRLKQWPVATARQAAKDLVQKGGASVPFLLLALRSADPRQRAGAAECLGRLKVAASFQDLRDATREQSMRPHLQTLLTALARIDREAAYPTLLEFLRESTHTGSYPAFQILEGITRREHLPQLANLFSSEQALTRRYAVGLLIKICDHPEALELLLRALGDDNSKVACETAQLLGEHGDPKILPRLVALSSHADKRLRGYAAIALVYREDRFRQRLFEGEWIPSLLSSLRHDDPFVRGSAAMAMVNVGFYSDNAQILEIMDQSLAPVLIETMAGKAYFKDYAPLRPLVYQKLKKLTGEDFGSDITAWWNWWHLNRATFRAIRLLRGVSSEEIAQMTLECVRRGTSEERDILFFASPEKAVSFGFGGKQTVLVLDRQQLARIADALRDARFFELEDIYGERGEGGALHSLTLKIPLHIKKVEVHGHNTRPIAPILKEIDKIAEENRWQAYWDKGGYPEWLTWYREQSDWFAGANDPITKKRRTRNLILSSYGWLKGEARDRAAQHFLDSMTEDPWITPGTAELALLHVRSETGLPERSELLIRSVALAKDSIIVSMFVRYLADNSTARARSLLKLLLESADRAAVLQYIRHPDSNLRSVVAEVLGNYPSDETVVLYLSTLLRDESSQVRQAAVEGLGRQKAEIAWERLCQIAKNQEEGFELRCTALTAIGRISEERAIPILLENLSKGDPKMRGAIALSLGEIGGRTATQTLLALVQDPSSEVRETACNSLVRIKEPMVVEALARLACHEGKADVRILAIRTLGRIRPSGMAEKLAPLLDEENPEVRVQASLALAEIYDRRTIPVLIEALGEPRHAFLARRQLERLTLVSHPTQDALSARSRYREWWEANQDSTPKQWLFEALRQKGYPVTPLLDYMLGSPNPKLAEVLVHALADRDWFIRVEACRVLEETTGRSFGALDPSTGPQTTMLVRRAWEGWLQSEGIK